MREGSPLRKLQTFRLWHWRYLLQGCYLLQGRNLLRYCHLVVPLTLFPLPVTASVRINYCRPHNSEARQLGSLCYGTGKVRFGEEWPIAGTEGARPRARTTVTVVGDGCPRGQHGTCRVGEQRWWARGDTCMARPPTRSTPELHQTLSPTTFSRDNPYKIHVIFIRNWRQRK